MTPARPDPAWELLRLTAQAIRPYHDQVVIVGGFASLCYQWLPGFEDRGLAVLRTNDIDLALPEPLALQGGESLDQRLCGRGLERRTSISARNEALPCRYYLPGTPQPPRASDPYVECLVPMLGREREKPGRPQGDLLVASPVRFLDILVADAIDLDHPDHGALRIPHPLAFVTQ